MDLIHCSFLVSGQTKLSNTSDEAWKEREAAVLALGAIAEGCLNGLFPHLSEVILSLASILDLEKEFMLMKEIVYKMYEKFGF